MSNRRVMMFGLKNATGTNFLTNLVAYYSFDGSNATDIHTGTHNGTLNGAGFTFPTGKNGNSINFGNDGSTRFIQILDSTDFSFVNGTTPASGAISMWVNFEAFSSVGNWLINKRGATSGTDEWQLVYFENKLQFLKFEYNNNAISQSTATSTTPFSINTWYHILITLSDSSSVGSTQIYINGGLNVASNSNNGGTYTRMNDGTNDVRLGQPSWATNSDLKHRGLMDEIAIWKGVTFGVTQATELYNAGAGKFYNTF